MKKLGSKFAGFMPVFIWTVVVSAQSTAAFGAKARRALGPCRARTVSANVGANPADSRWRVA